MRCRLQTRLTILLLSFQVRHPQVVIIAGSKLQAQLGSKVRYQLISGSAFLVTSAQANTIVFTMSELRPHNCALEELEQSHKSQFSVEFMCSLPPPLHQMWVSKWVSKAQTELVVVSCFRVHI